MSAKHARPKHYSDIEVLDLLDGNSSELEGLSSGDDDDDDDGDFDRDFAVEENNCDNDTSAGEESSHEDEPMSDDDDGDVLLEYSCKSSANQCTKLISGIRLDSSRWI